MISRYILARIWIGGQPDVPWTAHVGSPTARNAPRILAVDMGHNGERSRVRNRAGRQNSRCSGAARCAARHNRLDSGVLFRSKRLNRARIAGFLPLIRHNTKAVAFILVIYAGILPLLAHAECASAKMIPVSAHGRIASAAIIPVATSATVASARMITVRAPTKRASAKIVSVLALSTIQCTRTVPILAFS